MHPIPAYFESIRQKAAARWDQLEGDPELAGPWRQLFRQVQSPRHVLSELLQNADDAGAREATARIENGVFVFEHDGEDFSSEHFASLCRFGYSNKRDLHTIGFRGIGFKSTFSLGDHVEVNTPSLSVRFDTRRFTEPRWLGTGVRSDGKTCIRVPIKDAQRRRELEKNLEEWRGSAMSLLFFRHLRSMRVSDARVSWTDVGVGPVDGSHWMVPGGTQAAPYLLIRSPAEAFPPDALVEIRQERAGSVEDAEYPPCRVELVLGARGRLFVVLPTGVETTLPFACNAPFIQDPARLKIKDPDISPTNRWLLRRAGRLAASAMLAWLKSTDLPQDQRARAYGLFPDVRRESNSLDASCAEIVQESFAGAIDGQRVLLTDDGCVGARRSVALPDEVLDVWEQSVAAKIFDPEGRPVFSRCVGAADRRKLVTQRLLHEVGKPDVILRLREHYPPQPEMWERLVRLWDYLAPELTHFSATNPGMLRVVPVQGERDLRAATEVVRLGERKLLSSDDDWKLLAAHLVVVDPSWLRFISEQSVLAEQRGDAKARRTIAAAQAVLKNLGLDGAIDVSKVIDRVAAAFFAGRKSVSDCARLAQVAAKLEATAGEHFRYVTCDASLRSPKEGVLMDHDGRLEALLPEGLRASRLLHPAYTRAFSSCAGDEWTKWIASGRAGLLTFPPLAEKEQAVRGRQALLAEIRKRGGSQAPENEYRTDTFVINDWDFDEAYWQHWERIAASDDRTWAQVGERIINQRPGYWTRASKASIAQVSTQRNTRTLTTEALLPAWIIRLRATPCLRDTRGFCHKPADLLRRTPDTEYLMDVEPFVHSSLDREVTRPLLDLLGVRSSPIGPAKLLDCLRALARSSTPPVQEVERWYARLDRMLDACSTADLQQIEQAFKAEKIVLTDQCVWTSSAAVYLTADEADVPGAALVRPSVKHLTLWRRVGVAERPTADLAISWLQTLPSGQKLVPGELARVRALLVRHPARIWRECGHWLNLAGEWVPVAGLAYALTMQSLVAWSHLHEALKQRIADLQRLSADVAGGPPFSSLPLLASCIEDRVYRASKAVARPERRDWLCAVGAGLSRIMLDDKEETRRVRNLAGELARTGWQAAPGLEVIPYVGGTPAGTPRRADVLWLGRVLYVNDASLAKLAKRVPDEIAKAFGRPDIRAALDYSFERAPDDVRSYLEENFALEAAHHAAAKTPLQAHEAPLSIADANASEAPRAAFASDGQVIDGTVTASSAVGAPGGGAEQRDDVSGEHDDTTDARHAGSDDTPRRVRSVNKAPVIDRYAATRGYQRVDDRRFANGNGSMIVKSVGDVFPWAEMTAEGTAVRYYWPRDHCLDHAPLEVPAPIWGLIDGRPELYAFVLTDERGDPIEFSGLRLRELKELRRLKIYPASYRLVVETEET